MPPFTVSVTLPLALPHVDGVDAMVAVGPGMLLTVEVDVAVQLFASVTVMV